ncbi:MAG: hypothetical protein ABFD92_00020 [Planctomycetaceae bacterium]|nr:hypothetical protein [Planctomycetaceae bacterium]
MRTLLTFLIAAFVLAGLVTSGGCASPASMQWAARGLEGVENAKGNDAAMANLAKKILDERLKSDLARVNQDILDAQSGTLKKEDGTAVVIDRDWIRAHGLSVNALIDQHAADVKKIDAGLAIAQKNLDEGPKQSIEKLVALRWSLGQQGTTEAQLAKLTDIVSGLLAKQSASPGK